MMRKFIKPTEDYTVPSDCVLDNLDDIIDRSLRDYVKDHPEEDAGWGFKECRILHDLFQDIAGDHLGEWCKLLDDVAEAKNALAKR